MKAYKIELLVLDFDQLGGDGIKSVLENSRYPNDCISPSAMSISEVDIGPWSDDNPLNSGKTRAAEYARIFPAEASPAAANGWLPIETAPKDGTVVLAARQVRHGREYAIEGMSKNSDGWWITADGNRPSQPTYWQPLPAAPQ